MPETLDTSIYDEVITVTNEDAFATGKELARTEGVLAGFPPGAALWAATQLAKRLKSAGKTHRRSFCRTRATATCPPPSLQINPPAGIPS